MKRTQLFSCLLFTAITTHCMEDKPQKQELANPWKAIDCQVIEKSLTDDYHNYLKNRLEEYKKVDFTPENMIHLISTGIFITGDKYIGLPYNVIRDENNDTFHNIAVKQQNLPVINYCVKGHGFHCITRDDFDLCLATCVKHLHPEKTDATEKTTAYEIIKTLCTKQGPNASIFTLREKSCRENLIKQLILLQIKHKKYKSDFVIEDELIAQHLTSGENDQSPIVLTDMYQTVANKKGNTLSHIVVELQNPDELHQLITKNYISPAINKTNDTVLDIALWHFQDFTHNISSLDAHKPQADQSRCCLFMLLSYIKSKQNGILDKSQQCCDKHPIAL